VYSLSCCFYETQKRFLTENVNKSYSEIGLLIWYVFEMHSSSSLIIVAIDAAAAVVMIRLPDVVVGGLRFYRDSIFYLSIRFIRQLPSELAERNSAKTGHVFGSECDLKMHVRNLGYLFSVKIGVQKPKPPIFDVFRRLLILTANLTAYICVTKQDIHDRPSALDTTTGLLHRLKMSRTLVHKRLKIGPEILPALRKFCILLHCQAAQTEVSKRN